MTRFDACHWMPMVCRNARTNRALRWLACATFVLSFACSDEELPLYEQDGVRYFANVDDPDVCPQAPEDVATYRDALLKAYPLEEPPGVIDYYKYRYFSDLADHGPCPPGAECVIDFSVHSVEELHRHEIAHATSETIFPTGSPFSEGYATGLSCNHGGRAIAPDADVFFRYEKDVGIGHEYHLAGALVLELLRRADTSALREAHELFWEKARSPERSAGQNREALNSALLEAYGATLDEVMATVRRPDMPSCLPVGRCDGRPLEPGLNVLERVCGSHAEFLLESGSSSVGIVADDRTQLFSCEAKPNHYPPRENSFATRPLGEDVGVYRDHIERILPAPPVRHLLGFSRGGDRSRAAVAMRPLPGAYLARCPDEDVEAIDFSVAFGSAISIPTAEGGYWFAYDFSGSERATVSDILSTWTTGAAEYLTAPDGLDAYVCERCTAAPEDECQRLSMVEQEPTESFWADAMGGASSSFDGVPNDGDSTSEGKEPELFARFEASERAYIYLVVESVPERATYLEFAPRFLPEPQE